MFTSRTASARKKQAAWFVAAALLVGLVLWGLRDTALAPTTGTPVSEPPFPTEAPRAALPAGSAAAGGAADTLAAKAASSLPLELPAGTPLWLQQLARQPICNANEIQRKGAAVSALSSGAPPWAREGREQAQERLRQIADRLTASPEAELHVMGLALSRQHEALAQEALQQHSGLAAYALLQLCDLWMHFGPELAKPAVCQTMRSEDWWGQGQTDRFGLALRGLGEARDDADKDRWLERAAQHAPELTPLDRLPAAMLAHAPPSWSPEDRADAVTVGLNVWTAQALANAQGLLGACRRERAPPGSVRQQHCLAIAEALDRSPSTWLLTRLGQRVGEWHGWEAKRLQQAEAEFMAGLSASVDLLPSFPPKQPHPGTCAWLPNLRDHVVLVASRGERAAQAHWVARRAQRLEREAAVKPPPFAWPERR